MKEIRDLHDLLEHDIQCLYSAEKLILAGLERMKKKANNKELEAAFEQHIDETEVHVKRLKQIAEMLEIDAEDASNAGIKGLIADGEKVIHKDATDEVLDATLIAGAQKIEHFEISAYGTAAHYAEQLGLNEIADMLRTTLEEEQSTDTRLNYLAKKNINQKAMHPMS